MKLRTFAFTMMAACSLFACDQISDALPEYTLGKSDGIPPVSGSTTFAVPQDFKCGNPITDPKMMYTITTSGTAEACTFTFAQDVVALKAAEYAGHPEIKGAQLVKRVDIEVNKLGVRDGEGKDIVPEDLNGTAFGTTIVTLKDLGQPVPFTKGIEGAPIDHLKAAVAAEKDIVIPIKVVVVVNMAPTPPATIELVFDAQPNLVFGF